MTKLESRWVNSIDASILQALVEGMDRSTPPAILLLQIVDDVAHEETETGSLSEVCEFIALQGPDWNGGSEDSIGVRVREHADGSAEVEWGGGDNFTWCSLSHLLDAIDNGNEVPDWYEVEWTEVWEPNNRVDGGAWVPRQMLASAEAK